MRSKDRRRVAAQIETVRRTADRAGQQRGFAEGRKDAIIEHTMLLGQRDLDDVGRLWLPGSDKVTMPYWRVALPADLYARDFADPRAFSDMRTITFRPVPMAQDFGRLVVRWYSWELCR